MPLDPEIVGHAIDPLVGPGLKGGGLAVMGWLAYRGMLRLHGEIKTLCGRFSAYQVANDNAHTRIEAAVLRQNGQIDQNTKAIAKIEGTCEERGRRSSLEDPR